MFKWGQAKRLRLLVVLGEPHPQRLTGAIPRITSAGVLAHSGQHRLA
jgi:hypothetical protein